MGCEGPPGQSGYQKRAATRAPASSCARLGQLLLLAGLLLLAADARTPGTEQLEQLDELDDFDEQLEPHELVDIRSSIISSLGLRDVPDPAKANVSQAEYERAHKEYLTRLRRSAEGDGLHRRLFTIHATGEPRQEGTLLSFPLSLNQEESMIESASLRLLLDHELDATSGALEVRVYRSAAAGRRAIQLLGRRSFQDSESARRRWIDFELREEAEASLESQAPVQLLVQLWHAEQAGRRPARDWSIGSASLNVHVLEEEHGSRSRRSVGSSTREHLMSLHRGRRTECRGEGKRCCRHRLNVMFKDLEGFDFIIQPKSFDAGYCKGRCPPRFNPAHHHALLQSLIWKENKSRAPRPCCAPSKLAELEILYFDEDDATKLKVSNWKDMRVLECACS